MEFPDDYGVECIEWEILGSNEYQLYADGTEIIASWKGDHEELTDFEVWGHG